MRTWLRALTLVTPVLAALACGGNVDSGNGGEAQCPEYSALIGAGTCSAAGQKCTASAPGCDNTFECTCTSGTWTCPAISDTCQVCPAAPTPGGSCTAAQVGCVLPATIPACNGGTAEVSCTCTTDPADSSGWSCDDASAPVCQPDANACPAPSAVVAGDACDLPLNVECASDIPIKPCFDGGGNAGFVLCDCTAGVWGCGSATPTCVDGGACPAPTMIDEDVPCQEEGQRCPGSPVECGGEVFDEQFVCGGGVWNAVLVGSCNYLDAGPPDSGPPDSGPPDSGDPDEGIVDAGLAPGHRPGR